MNFRKYICIGTVTNQSSIKVQKYHRLFFKSKNAECSFHPANNVLLCTSLYYRTWLVSDVFTKTSSPTLTSAITSLKFHLVEVE